MNDQVEITGAHAELCSLLSAFIAQSMSDDTDTLLRFVKRADLTLPLLAVLSLVERDGAISIGEFSASLDYSLANASLLVDKLVCQGCVTRIENASDRRHKLVQLTPKGQALLAELREARAENIARQLRLLPPDLIAQTIGLLRTITEELALPPASRTTNIGDAAAR
jgi:DNA-binding MarR family transcriptional regulator